MPADNSSDVLLKRWVRRKEAKHLGRGQLAAESWLETPHTKKASLLCSWSSCSPASPGMTAVLAGKHLDTSYSSLFTFSSSSGFSVFWAAFRGPQRKWSGRLRMTLSSPFRSRSFSCSRHVLLGCKPTSGPCPTTQGHLCGVHSGSNVRNKCHLSGLVPEHLRRNILALSIHQHVLRENRFKKCRVREKPAQTSPEMTKGSKQA